MGAQHENELAPWADNWGERFHAAGHDFLARIAAVLPSITNHAGVMHLSMTPELCNLPPRYRGFQPAQLTGVATVLFVVEISTASIAGGNGITEEEVKDIEELATPRTPVIYEVVRRLGEEEMVRPATSLWWSGVAAGLSISFSLLAQAILRTHLPDAPWEPLVTSFGYCVGFIMAVLSRQQLFTESTITAVLPVAAEFTWKNVGRMTRLWAIVLAANLTGTLFAALFCSFAPVLSTEIYAEMLTISRDLLGYSWWEMAFAPSLPRS